MTDDALLSPMLGVLADTLAAGDTEALTEFWAEVERIGTPLVEPVPGEPLVPVTFLWRDDGRTENVLVVSDLHSCWSLGDPHANVMQRLPKSDVWYRTYLVRPNIRTTYQLSPNDPLTEMWAVADWNERAAGFVPDPLNPRQLVIPLDEEQPETTGNVASIVEGPAAPPQPWIEPRDVPHGDVTLYRLRSEILDNERRVWVYTSPGYDTADRPADLLILFDGWAYVEVVPTPTILDNLVAEGLLGPIVAVFPASLSIETRSRELPPNEPYQRFLSDELLPFIRERYRVTDDPTRVVLGGSSFGGLAAAGAAMAMPHLFGNVLSQSGSFWWHPGWTMDWPADQEYEWIARQLAVSPRLPLRFHVEAGLLEVGQMPNHAPHQLTVNRHVRNVLQAKEYPLDYLEYTGGHDYVNWRGTLPEGLLALLGPESR